MHFFYLLFQVHAFFQITTRISLARWATMLFDSTKLPKTFSDSDFSDSNDFLDCLNNIGKEKNGSEYNWIVLYPGPWMVVASIRQDLVLLQGPLPLHAILAVLLPHYRSCVRSCCFVHIIFVEQKRRDSLQHCTVILLFRNH